MTRMQRRYRRFPRLMFLQRLWQGINYEKEMELLDVLCDSRKTSVDVGAKLGMYSHRLLRHSRDVVAVEPIPLLVYMLERVFRWRRCQILPCALSHEAGRARFLPRAVLRSSEPALARGHLRRKPWWHRPGRGKIYEID